MLILFGVRFQPKKAEILSMISDVTKGRGGISMESLIGVFYPGISKRKAEGAVRVQINQINDLLIQTDYRIDNCYLRDKHKTQLYRLVSVEGKYAGKGLAQVPALQGQKTSLDKVI